MGGENLRLSINCLYGYVIENFGLSHREFTNRMCSFTLFEDGSRSGLN